MSYSTWHDYGYGFCTDEIEVESVAQLEELLSRAPEFRKKIHEQLADCDISEPTVEDYYECDEDYHYEIAGILSAVINEATGIGVFACDSSSSERYVLFPPIYPWKLDDRDRTVTIEELEKVYTEYVSIISNVKLNFDYQSVENGG